MTKCRCRKGAVALDCPRHIVPTYYLSPPRSRSLWQRLLRWLGA